MNRLPHQPQAGETLADEAYDLLLWADRLTTEELTYLMGLAGRTSGPMFLEEALSEGKIADETVTALIGDVWSSAEFPDRHLDHDTWRWMFDVAGFTVDGKQAQRPTEPITLYRGSVPERRTDWSWTRDIRVAEKFAAGSPGRPPSRVWVCVVPPTAMLAVNTGRNEDEIVVDTRGLQITEYVR
ncbi:hypothetical protein GA0115233_10308 [Streptomyces sp. DI166]|uniref:hypothetical protein n=1 Tax=Streptomyces sp. DI166 TaxID=1839783 RepID=UPI0007F495B6|nr:hypothetical protein [Streptomyces sp. DI166]SBT91376.1 hypothetical protein GA0115233_10308 [Streptomyces sp. DI166]